ncbi:MAG: rhodanese-like domain-containing protein [Polyangiaceae bacterium]|nr:rhodanese-like domain-containing protein [Polyangiaceae bacterium]
MAHAPPDPASLIPPIGTIPQADRMFRVNWVSNLTRGSDGAPQHSPHFVAKQGRRVRLIDIREDEELLGPLGYIPGCDWVPESRVMSLPMRVDEDEPVIVLSSEGVRAEKVAFELEQKGLRFVAAMTGGIMAWRDLGYSTSRDASVKERRDVLHRTVVHPLAEGQELSRSHVEEHVGEASSVRWVKMAALLLHGRLSCVDGRDDSSVLGTPGGDAGELVLALSALEKLSGKKFTQPQVEALLQRRLDMLGRFYYHTDVHAANHAIKDIRGDHRFDDAISGISEALEWRAFWRNPPERVKTPLLQLALSPNNIGCGHLKRALTLSDTYQTRSELVGAVLQSYHHARWAGSADTELVVLGGEHHEGAVLIVRVEGEVHPFTRIPLVSPSAFGKQMFIYHPQVASYLRRQLAEMIALQKDLVPVVSAADLHTEMEKIAQVQLNSTLGALAKGLPIFEITFDSSNRATVKALGHVG